jgi:hypothetical protein
LPQSDQVLRTLGVQRAKDGHPQASVVACGDSSDQHVAALNGDQLGAEIYRADFKPPVVAGGRNDVAGIVGRQQLRQPIYCGFDLLPFGLAVPATLLQSVQHNGQRQVPVIEQGCSQIGHWNGVRDVRQPIPRQHPWLEVKLCEILHGAQPILLSLRCFWLSPCDAHKSK